MPDVCPVFGTPFEVGSGGKLDESPSLDRIDNAKGYVRGNVWVISWRANRIKGDASIEELRAVLRSLEARAS